MNTFFNTKIAKGALGLLIGAAMVGCSSSSSSGGDDPEPTTAVSVMDPYAVGCTVTSGGLTAAEPDPTNSPGRYSFTGEPVETVHAVGCVDKATGMELPPMTSTPEGTVVTPLTTLVQQMLEKGHATSATDASAKVAQALGLTLPTGVDIQGYDALADRDTNPEAAKAVQALSSKVSAMLAIGEGAGIAAGDVIDAVVEKLNDSSTAGSTLDLDNVATLQDIITTASPEIDDGFAGELAKTAREVNLTITAAVSSSSAGNAVAVMARAVVVAGVFKDNIQAKVQAGETATYTAPEPADVQMELLSADIDATGFDSAPLDDDGGDDDETGATGASS